MNVAAEYLFWFCLSLIAYTYFLYPVVLFILYAASQVGRDLRYLNDRADRRRKVVRDDELPPVSLIIPAHNEQDCCWGKVENLKRLDYPPEKIEIIFISDGSTDKTGEILARWTASNVRVILLPERRGKASALNYGIAHSNNNLLILSDAATLFAPDAVKKLVRHFRDPVIGVVCGALQFQGNAEHRQTEGVYWRYETAMRLMEARLGVTLTASGAIYAIRRECYRQLPPNVLVDDFVVPMNARRAGYQVVYDPEAMAIDFGAGSVADEFTRRVRLAIGSFKALAELSLVPLEPLTFLAFVSHKILRWVLPLLMIGLLTSNLLLLDSAFYRVTFVGQSLLCVWAVTGYFLRNRVQKARFALMGYFLLAVHIAYLVGLARVLVGREEVKWQRVS